MVEKGYSKTLTILLIVGIVVILGVLIVAGIMIANSNSLNQDASEAVEQFKGNKNSTLSEDKKNNTVNGNSGSVNTVINNSIDGNSIAPSLEISNDNGNGDNGSANQGGNGSSTQPKQKQLYKGFPMVGTIEIPSISLKYPVLESATADAIEVSVGIFEGVGLNKVGNTTIAGHNYRNGTLFSNLQRVKNGDKVYITDEDGNKVTYIIYKTFTTTPEDSSFMDRDTEGKREITLDTCTDDSLARFLAFAREQ